MTSKIFSQGDSGIFELMITWFRVLLECLEKTSNIWMTLSMLRVRVVSTIPQKHWVSVSVALQCLQVLDASALSAAGIWLKIELRSSRGKSWAAIWELRLTEREMSKYGMGCSKIGQWLLQSCRNVSVWCTPTFERKAVKLSEKVRWLGRKIHLTVQYREQHQRSKSAKSEEAHHNSDRR